MPYLVSKIDSFFLTSSTGFPFEPYHYYIFFKMSNEQLNNCDFISSVFNKNCASDRWYDMEQYKNQQWSTLGKILVHVHEFDS